MPVHVGICRGLQGHGGLQGLTRPGLHPTPPPRGCLTAWERWAYKYEQIETVIISRSPKLIQIDVGVKPGCGLSVSGGLAAGDVKALRDALPPALQRPLSSRAPGPRPRGAGCSVHVCSTLKIKD